GPDDIYFTDVDGIPLQIETIRNKGSQYQWSFSYGGNVNDLLYFGLGLGIVDLNYRSERVYSESFVVDPLFETELTEVLEIGGTGVNGTIGFILKPAPFINIGASFISPTYYGLDDTYTADMYADWNNYLYEDAIDGDTLLNFVSSQTDILISDYNLTTPWRLNGGVAFFIGKIGFITADVEYIDYSTVKLNSNLFSMGDDNEAIKQMASAVVNFKTGAEFRINALRLRAGYANYSTAQGTLDPLEGNSNVFTGGLGIRLNKFYIDLGVVHNQLSQSYAPYLIEQGVTPVADITSNNTKMMLTMGFNF
ncbi:MAG: long-chain fatty acid transporter, partial [Saprospiraceae bacterium]|nr:long-chain fatty acid transporter [Saprospiraceae bacterium]